MMRKTRRVLLVGAALLLATGNIWWFTRGGDAPQPDFVLGTGLEKTSVPAEALPSLPRYDAAGTQWREQGRPLASIGDRVRPYSGDGASGWKPKSYVTIGVEASAGPDELRPIFLDLARKGICDVAVVQDGTAPGQGGEIEVFIQHIVSVKDGKGVVVNCAPPQSAAAPSSASK